jgi:hypothetical protein
MKRRTVFLFGEPWCATSDNPALTHGCQHDTATGTRSGQYTGKGF